MNLYRLLSGKFWLTIIVGFTFAYLSCHGILPPDKSMEIILLVTYAYFTKKDNNPPKSSV